MKKLFAGIATQNYCCYLAGRFDEKLGHPQLSLKEFCADVERISKRGQGLFKERLRHGNVP